MPHLYYALDYTVSVFVVHEQKVLLVRHRALQKWLPLGGHIEIGEDPEAAVYREVAEESGLEVAILGSRPQLNIPGTTFLHAPAYLDVHEIRGDHRHVGMIYFATAATATVALATREHEDIRWFSSSDIDDGDIAESVRFYARQALQRAEASDVEAHA